MARHLLDRVLALIALAFLSPIWALAAAGVRLSSPGPILYRARRAGLGGRVFSMYKFRTMHVEQGPRSSRISAHRDPRIFTFGSILRTLKVDETPQLLNILRGEMAIIGPRPEDPEIVEQHYTPAQRETLTVLPGLASPGSIYNYTHGEEQLGAADPEADYVERLLPLKLALDTVYVRQASLWYDAGIVLRTAGVILGRVLGRRAFPDPPEMPLALAILHEAESRGEAKSLNASQEIDAPREVR